MPVDAAIMAVVDHLEIDESAFSGARPLPRAADQRGLEPKHMTVDRIRTEALGDDEGKRGES